MPPVCAAGIRSVRYTLASATAPVAATAVTGPIRPIIATDSSGSVRVVAEHGLARRRR